MRTAYFGYRGVRILSVLILTVGKFVAIVVKEGIFRIQWFFSDTAQMSLKCIIAYLGDLPVLTEFMSTVKLGFKEVLPEFQLHILKTNEVCILRCLCWKQKWSPTIRFRTFNWASCLSAAYLLKDMLLYDKNLDPFSLTHFEVIFATIQQRVKIF